MRNLHTRWNSFTFDPTTDDIEVFLRNVQETAKQLEYREATVVNMIKSKMQLAMYSTLYDIHELDKVVTRCRDIYAKSIDATAESSTATGGATAANPFSAMKDEFFFMDDGAVNAQKQKPFKPHVTPQGRGKKKGRGGSRGGKGRGGQQRGNNPRQNNFNRGQSNRGGWQPRGRGGRGGYDRSPNQRKPRVAYYLTLVAEPLTRTGVTTAMSLDISQENAPRGIMAITTTDHNSTKLFQDLMWSNHRCMLRCQFLKWLKFQFKWHFLQPKYRCRTTA